MRNKHKVKQESLEAVARSCSLKFGQIHWKTAVPES